MNIVKRITFKSLSQFDDFNEENLTDLYNVFKNGDYNIRLFVWIKSLNKILLYPISNIILIVEWFCNRIKRLNLDVIYL